jgi:hypothetical protein
MNRYPHRTPWAPAIGIAAALATVATMGLAIVLPAGVHVNPAADSTMVVTRDARPGEVTIQLERVEIVTTGTAVSVGKPASEALKQRV